MSFFERLAKGPGGAQPKDYDDWNEMVGSAPREQFGRASYDAVRQVDPDEYYRHTQPGVGGTDPYGSLAPEQRSGLGGSILGELTRRGVSRDEISRDAGLRNMDPERMSPEDLAGLSQWTQKNHPKAYGRVAAEYQDKPDILSSLLGNKALLAVAAGLGAKFLADRSKRR